MLYHCWVLSPKTLPPQEVTCEGRCPPAPCLEATCRRGPQGPGSPAPGPQCSGGQEIPWGKRPVEAEEECQGAERHGGLGGMAGRNGGGLAGPLGRGARAGRGGECHGGGGLGGGRPWSPKPASGREGGRVGEGFLSRWSVAHRPRGPTLRRLATPGLQHVHAGCSGSVDSRVFK